MKKRETVQLLKNQNSTSMEVENFNNNLFCLVMINSYFKAGKLVKEASSEVKMCRPDIKVTEVLIAKGIVGSAPALS